MNNPYVRWLLVVLVLLVPVVIVAWPTNTDINLPLPWGGDPFTRDISIRQGLDLQGGLQVLLEAELPANQTIDSADMETVRSIIENRVNSLGVSEPVVQVAGDRRVVVELPGLDDPEEALALLKQTGLLEFVDTGAQSLAPGTLIQTDIAITSNPAVTPTVDPTLGATADATQTGEATPTETPAEVPAGPVYHTIMTGAALESARVDTTQGIVVAFTLTDEGSQIFGQHSSTHINQYLTIALDKRVISSPQINAVITDEGVIQGGFTLEEANQLTQVLRYGSLPVPLRVAESRIIGPSLGQDSLNKSLVAGAIGISAVIIFMLLYYRVPGFVASVSIIIYALIALAVFKLIPVTLTLAGVAGFMLSTGSALDANILIFERLKEELRDGKAIGTAMELAWRRAWSSIRDSNIATIIICLILLWFASSFGATIVRGFAITLLIGVGISLFTALVLTRVMLHSVLAAFKPGNYSRWFGI
jgi:preprotein translocase subunit SecD